MGIFFHQHFLKLSDITLTALLLILAALTVGIALFGQPVHKALLCAWIVLP